VPSGTLGTFGGVFTPSILTILGVIMYLRFGWVVGNVGLLGTLAIVTISTGITFLTALSIAAIATDRRVRVGGAYYMISRALGIETGGAVGIPLYLAQALSIALYTVGFAESVAQAFPGTNERLVGLVTTVLVGILAIRSAKVAIRAQYFIMAAIALSLISLVFGQSVGTGGGVSGTVADPAGFWVVFAVFFPAVTGIMAGVNMSGDLKDPALSIPKGTLAAVGVGYLIYMTLPILLAFRADPGSLASDPLIMRRMAVWGDAILLGVWGATLSSAVGSVLAAPRVLQALAHDGVLPRSFHWLAKGGGPNDEPRLGTAFTVGVALAAVMLGNLNVIAPILTMFFLTTYLVLNIAAGTEGLLKSPSYRPSFRVHWSLSLLGALGCLFAMFLVNPVATVLAAVVVSAIFLWLERRGLQAAFGDVRRGLWLALIRGGVLRLGASDDSKNWRPHLLVLSGAPTQRWNMIALAEAVSHSRGLITVASILPVGSRDAGQLARLEGTIREYLGRRGVEALVRLTAAPNPFEGAVQLIQTYGLGALQPNTVLLGDSEREESRGRYAEMIRAFHQMRRNVLILHESGEGGFGDKKRIDVWWGGLEKNGGLMLILAYLLRTHVGWRDAEIRLKLVVPNETAAAAARTNLDDLVGDLRIGAEPEVLVSEGRPFEVILRESSAGADLIFMGMAEPKDDFPAYMTRMQALTQGLPTTITVLAAQDVAFAEVLR
jgi:amino acid transporter